MNELLKLNNVKYLYINGSEKVQAIKNASASFYQGKIYAITGRSGSGKSTILSLMAGLDNVSEGDILYNQKSLRDIDRDLYRSKDIGIIFQSYNLLTQLTALENVMLSLEVSGLSVANKKVRCLELLSRVGIDDSKVNRRVLKLSGGEQQRIAIARALAPNPQLILADEPTGNLDQGTEDAVLKILQDLAHEENKTVIMITHSKDIADKCDEIYGMKDGVLLPIKVS
ncbi:ABC transporter ATP-binding protein [Clostridium sp. 'deep sea']|uniref:ABC transporter ATP-binding protein n=1 Tax=Clostridium sp. 'deep sea' TaxID=2779445 RepID=UPI0018967F55|nr:ABC transporter ATP-binding protein [Clostridium sp. 'deep sea']QOR35253.1 ABC transporter ATP-binding protein [Clostridium sp. 'deep sea']